MTASGAQRGGGWRALVQPGRSSMAVAHGERQVTGAAAVRPAMTDDPGRGTEGRRLVDASRPFDHPGRLF